MGDDHPDRLVAAGWALVRGGNSRAAAREFKAALAGDGGYEPALTGLAQAQFNLGEITAGQETAEALLRRNAGSAAGHRLLAEALRRRKKPAEALVAARQAIALAPREPLGFHILGLILSGRKDHKGALAACEQGLAAAPGHAVLMAQRADALLELRGPAAASSSAGEALRLDPDSAFVKRLAARIALAGNQVERARDLLASVLRRDAQNQSALELYLLTEPRRHRFLRTLFIFRYWRIERGWLGTLVGLALVGALIILAIAVAFITSAPGVLFGLGFRWFMHLQYDAHRRAVKAHFAEVALNAGF